MSGKRKQNPYLLRWSMRAIIMFWFGWVKVENNESKRLLLSDWFIISLRFEKIIASVIGLNVYHLSHYFKWLLTESIKIFFVHRISEQRFGQFSQIQF
jgi:hypothetical protein